MQKMKKCIECGELVLTAGRMQKKEYKEPTTSPSRTPQPVSQVQTFPYSPNSSRTPRQRVREYRIEERISQSEYPQLVRRDMVHYSNIQPTSVCKYQLIELQPTQTICSCLHQYRKYCRLGIYKIEDTIIQPTSVIVP